MWRSIILGVVAVSVSKVASAQPQMQPNFGGGFIEFLFGDSAQQPQRGTQQ
jgi:hypothetical protein